MRDINFIKLIEEGKESGRVLSFNDYEINEEFGDKPFAKFDDGTDVRNYFFKIDSDEGNRAFALTIGKLSEFEKPTDPKDQYSVLSLVELTEKDLDQAVIDNGKFEENKNLIVVSDADTSKILTNIASCVSDYLENNPKIHKFYDEVPNLIRNETYNDKLDISLEKWPGADAWKLQPVEPEKFNIITK